MGVGLFVENLRAFPAERCKRLNARLKAAGLAPIEAVYALVWPDYELPNPPRPQENRERFSQWRNEAGVPLWAWVNCLGKTFDQARGAAAINMMEATLDPDGWKLDMEGDWVKGSKLATILAAPVATGKPRSASLAGASASHVNIDYRELERQGYVVSWQAYFDSGEGPPPPDAVREMYQSSFVLQGEEYRARIGKSYGWTKVRFEGQTGTVDSYRHPGWSNAFFAVKPREWGATVVSRDLFRSPDGDLAGLLMGRVEYKRIRVTLDITRSAQARPVEQWQAIAAGARFPGAAKRPVDVYLAENDNDLCDRIFAIAKGAA